MATITSPDVIKKILDNDGVYPGDPQCFAVFEYTNGASDDAMWAIAYSPQAADEITSSPYVRNPKTLWTRQDGRVERAEFEK